MPEPHHGWYGSYGSYGPHGSYGSYGSYRPISSFRQKYTYGPHGTLINREYGYNYGGHSHYHSGPHQHHKGDCCNVY